MSAAVTAAVGLAGGAGAVARVVLDGAAAERWGPTPRGLLLVNALGSLLLGVVTGLVMSGGAPDALRLVVGVGFCGGFTTFSAVSVVSVRLAQQQRYAAALGNAFGTLALTVAAGALGLAAAAG